MGYSERPGWAEEQALQLVQPLYDASMEPALWPDWLGRLSEALRGESAMLVSYEPRTLQVHDTASVGLDAESVSAYLRHHHADNPLLRMVRGQSRPLCMASEEMLPVPALERMHFYQAFLRPLAVKFGVLWSIPAGADRMVFAGTARSARAGPSTAGERRLGALLTPHLQRAFQLQALVERERSRAEAGEWLLERMGIGAMLLDATGAVVAANAAAERMLGRGTGLQVRQGRVRVRQPALTERLNALVQSAVSVAEGHGLQAGGALRVPAAEPEAAGLSVVVVPMRDAQHNLGVPAQQRVCAALLLTPTPPGGGPSMRLLQGLYGLTEREAQVVSRLARGEAPQAIAAALGLRATTVRTHLNQALAKTGTTRQAALVQRALRETAGITGPV